MPRHARSQPNSSTEALGWLVGADASSAPVASLAIEVEGTTVRIVRRISCGEAMVAQQIGWSMDCGDAARCRDVHEAVLERSEDVAFWFTGAIAFGRDWADTRIGAVVACFLQKRMAEAEADERARSKARLDAIEKAEQHKIGIYFLERKGRYLIALQRRGPNMPELWTIAFDESWERDRFLDWFRWQKERFETLVASVGTIPATDLERDLLEEMLRTEQAVRKAGLGAGGRRPLRFWKGAK